MYRAVKMPLPKSRLAAFCRKHHIRRLALFGSVLRDDFRPGSDVDVLVEFEPGHTPGFFGLARMEMELSDLAGGRKVDLNTPGCFRPGLREKILSEARVCYGQTG